MKIFAFISIFILSLLSYNLYAANIAIWPIQLNLYPEKNTENIRLTNKGDTPVKVQISAKTWDIDEAGEFIETNTGEFVFYPRLLELPPNEEKLIRVGYQGDFPPIEQPFRLLIKEVPPVLTPEQQQEQVGTNFSYKLTLSLPLFVMPSKKLPQPEIAIEGIQKTAESLKIGIKAPGTHHVHVTQINAQLLDQQQQTLTSGENKTHLLRVLPKRRVFVDIPMDTSLCSQAKTLQVSVEAKDLKTPYQTEFELNNTDCQPN